MHPNPAFRQTGADDNLAYARERGFGALTVSTDGAPLVSHVPFLLAEDGATAELHLVRSNPMVKTIRDGVPARMVVSGPDGYVSPDWYGAEDQVPTWNYVAVHLTGALKPLPPDALGGVLDRLSAHFETQLLPKPAWTMAKMTPDVRDRMMRMILPFRLDIEDVQGTWKLGQNKPEAARLSAADHMDAHAIGQDARVLAGLMKTPIEDRE